MKARCLRVGVFAVLAGAGVLMAAQTAGATAPTAPATVAFRLQPALSSALPQYARITWSRPTGGDTPTSFDVGIGVDPDDTGASPIDWASADAVPAEISVSATLTTKVISCGVALPKRCWIRVRARAGATLGDWSTPVAWSWVPSAPRGFKRTGISGTTATFTWRAPAAPGYLTTNYQLQRSVDRGTTWSNVGATTTALTTSDACPATTNCMYQVRAVNSDGTGLPSNRNILQTMPTVPLYLVLGLTESNPASSGGGAGTSTLELAWARPLRGTPTGYQLQVCPGVCTATTLDALWTSAATQPGPTDLSATGLTCPAGAATCTVRLRGVLTQGATTVYGPWAVRTLRPYAPPSLTASYGTTADHIRVSFPQPLDLGGGAAADRTYQFLVCETSCGSSANWDVDTGATIAVDSVLTYPHVQSIGCPGETACSVRMVLVDGLDRSSPLTAAVTETGSAVPSPPLDVAAVTGTTAGTIDVTWTAPAEAGYPAIDHYETSISVNGGSYGGWVTTGGTATSKTLSCAGGATCSVRVRAVNAVLASDPSDADSADGAEVPSAPQNLSASPATTSGQVDLAWDAPSNLGTPELTEYEWRRRVSGVWSAWFETNSTDLTVTDTGCGAGVTCTYEVRAKNAVGSGAASSQDSAVGAEVPSAPQNLTAAATANAGEILLDWDAPSNLGSPALTEYEWRRQVGGVWSDWYETNDTATTYLDTACGTGVTCTYEVRAKNAVGTGASSGTASDTAA